MPDSKAEVVEADAALPVPAVLEIEVFRRTAFGVQWTIEEQ